MNDPAITQGSLDPSLHQALVSLMLPLAATLEIDHWRVFLAVCGEDGISLQKLGRLTGLSQSAIIRATSMLESWSIETYIAPGLLHIIEEEARSFRRLSFLSEEGKKLRDILKTAFGEEDFADQALSFHQFLQQELAQHWQQAA